MCEHMIATTCDPGTEYSEQLYATPHLAGLLRWRGSKSASAPRLASLHGAGRRRNRGCRGLARSAVVPGCRLAPPCASQPARSPSSAITGGARRHDAERRLWASTAAGTLIGQTAPLSHTMDRLPWMIAGATSDRRWVHTPLSARPTLRRIMPWSASGSTGVTEAPYRGE